MPVYIGAGSNMGNRFENLYAAWVSLNEILKEAEYSSLWETQPLIFVEQPAFYNMVFSGTYGGSAHQLLKELNRIEALLGRNRESEIPKGPRTMDLDLLYFGNEEYHDKTLTLPHPGIRDRAFVLMPLLELLGSDHPHFYELISSMEKNRDQGVECKIDRTKSKKGFWKSGEVDYE